MEVAESLTDLSGYLSFWPYKRVFLTLRRAFTLTKSQIRSGLAKNWPYKRVDLTSVALTSGLHCTCDHKTLCHTALMLLLCTLYYTCILYDYSLGLIFWICTFMLPIIKSYNVLLQRTRIAEMKSTQVTDAGNVKIQVSAWILSSIFFTLLCNKAPTINVFKSSQNLGADL